jgi:hypothetical protein
MIFNKIYHDYLHVKIDIEPVKYDKSISTLINNNDYLDEKIYTQIIETMKDISFYNYTFENTSVELYIYSSKQDKTWNRLLVFYTNYLIYLFQYINPHTRNLKLILINYKGLKLMPISGDLTAYHVNSGVTMGNTVIVYRYEEMLKVLTHELIHYFNIDQKYISPELEEKLTRLFNINCKSITINESFVDAFACYINTAMYSILSDTDFKTNLLKEINFIVKQAAKVLNYINYPNLVCEKTHVTSYYVIKALIYLHMDKYMAYLEKHNYIFKNSKEYIEIIDFNDLNFILKQKSNSKTMRMSSLDIKNIKKFLSAFRT